MESSSDLSLLIVNFSAKPPQDQTYPIRSDAEKNLIIKVLYRGKAVDYFKDGAIAYGHTTTKETHSATGTSTSRKEAHIFVNSLLPLASLIPHAPSAHRTPSTYCTPSAHRAPSTPSAPSTPCSSPRSLLLGWHGCSVDMPSPEDFSHYGLMQAFLAEVLQSCETDRIAVYYGQSRAQPILALAGEPIGYMQILSRVNHAGLQVDFGWILQAVGWFTGMVAVHPALDDMKAIKDWFSTRSDARSMSSFSL